MSSASCLAIHVPVAKCIPLLRDFVNPSFFFINEYSGSLLEFSAYMLLYCPVEPSCNDWVSRFYEFDLLLILMIHEYIFLHYKLEIIIDTFVLSIF